MRVMLILPFTDVNPEFKHAPRPEIGDVDEVMREMRHDETGDLYYHLARFGRFYAYQANLFATLPDITADEMEEKKLELQTA
jgi:hypothetical protein